MQLRRRAYKDPHRLAHRWTKRARFTNVNPDTPYPPVKKLVDITPIIMPSTYKFVHLWTSKPTIAIGVNASGVIVPNSGTVTWRLIEHPADYIIKANFEQGGGGRPPQPYLLHYGELQRVINLLQFKLTGKVLTVCWPRKLSVDVSFSSAH